LSISEDKYRRLRQELIGGIFALIVVFLLGTLWYHLIEGWSWLDSAYMTISTLATVGFGEINPLGERGRLFTMVLIIMGVVSIGYIVNRLTEALIQGYFQEGLKQRQEKRLIDRLSEHYIICGLGRTGRQVAIEFYAENIPFVVIDTDPLQVNRAKELNYIVVQGEYTVLSAKTLNPKIRAIARASTEEAVQKLQRAGADAVVSPYITGGRRLAAAALRPQVMDFVDGILTGTDRSFYMEEFLIDPRTCPCVGLSLSQAHLRSRSGALVLAIRRADGTLIGGPTGDTELMAGDLLICMGTAEQLRSLTQILIPMRSDGLRLPKH